MGGDRRDGIVGTPVVAADGQPVGVVAALMIGPQSRLARWLLVTLSDAEGARVVPVEAASADALGRIRIPWNRQVVSAAPSIDGNIVSEAEATRIHEYFGMPSER
jgi:hypothetical protein